MIVEEVLKVGSKMKYMIEQLEPNLKEDYLKTKEIFGFNSDPRIEREELLQHLESYEKKLKDFKLICAEYYNLSREIIESLEKNAYSLSDQINCYHKKIIDLELIVKEKEKINKRLIHDLNEVDMELTDTLLHQNKLNVECHLSNIKKKIDDQDETKNQRIKSEECVNPYEQKKKMKDNENECLIRRLDMDLKKSNFQIKELELDINHLMEKYDELQLEHIHTVFTQKKLERVCKRKETDIKSMQKEFLKIQNELDYYKKIYIYHSNIISEGVLISFQKYPFCEQKEFKKIQSVCNLSTKQVENFKNETNLFDMNADQTLKNQLNLEHNLSFENLESRSTFLKEEKSEQDLSFIFCDENRKEVYEGEEEEGFSDSSMRMKNPNSNQSIIDE